MSGSADLFEAVKVAAAIRLPGVPMETVDHEARWAAAEFLRASRCWRRVVDVPITGGTAEYTVPGLADVESVAVLIAASIEGTQPLRLGAISQFALSDGVEGTPSLIGMATDRMIRVYPVPPASDAGKAIVLDLALTLLVTQDALLPDELRPYQEHLVDGVLARLYGMPDKPWSNNRYAETHLRRFENGKASVRREMDTGRTFGGLTMRIPRFGA